MWPAHEDFKFVSLLKLWKILKAERLKKKNEKMKKKIPALTLP